MNVVYLIVCGAGPTMHAAGFVEAARASGWDCHVIATPTGAAFADLDALEAASGHPVTTEHRKPGTPRRDRPNADAVVIAPATANTICKLAAGIADTYALDVASEHIGLGIPTLVVPFANTALTGRVPYLRATATLTEEGVTFLELAEHEPHHGGPLAEQFPWHQAMTQAAKLAETRRSEPEPTATSWSGPAEPPPTSNTHELPESR
ncbi:MULTISPECIES: flavoprotein [Glycomyces]|uniref:Flavoprotein n=2 Tax=Glycomyces TaxID=58113 RepID=A0A9X3T9K7_9ACTN|nr:flavoprotein [Glycomyces lechevalierae]MDA1386608.1 flavoprotein [Glycomyces lechevalierae]MDR7340676.1 phosphopantothenoylcysteine synthetase/decarboxylase [Glycomyces lechevalierae]